MQATRSSNKVNPEQAKRTWRKLVLPTLLTVAIGSIGSLGAKPLLALGPRWVSVMSESVDLDQRPYKLSGDQDSSVARLGLSPNYFIQYYSPGGKLHWITLANKKGAAITDPKLLTVDPLKHSVRYVVVMKDHQTIEFDERKSPTIEGSGAPPGGTAIKFKAFSVPREGVKPDFHPADVSRVELQIRSRR